ncbi:MAG: hypothetical protein ACE14M_05800 [Terriglobales bacterium]
MPSQPSIRQRLNALEWVRKEMMRKGSPDFLRARLREQQIRNRCEELVRAGAARPKTGRLF